MAWYALWVMSRAEFAVEDALRAYDVRTFLPTFTDVVQWSDRKKTIRRPLFPGYLFAELDAIDMQRAIHTAGVIEILPSSLKPQPVNATDIGNIRALLATGLNFAPCDFVEGDAVLIDSGPLAGVKGIVRRTKNGTRVIVRVELLQRAVSVEIDARELQKEKKAA